jgi:hypothetical protein
VTVHYNGWCNYPNPNGYTTENIYSTFEGAFVRDHITAQAVAQQLGSAAPSSPACYRRIGFSR